MVEMSVTLTKTCHMSEAELAQQYRETYGSDSYSPEQLARLMAKPSRVVYRERRRRS